jgi:MoaA/NifB/PqqE/SkfB family radical SAM enzyme
LRSFIKQAYFYGRGNLLVQYIHNDQPLLKELKTGNLSFYLATLINSIKIPRFGYIIGKRLIQEYNIKNRYKKLSVYSFFILHKVFYILGNIVEFLRIRQRFPKNNSNLIQLPRLLILDITHSCNLKCRICDIWKTGTSEADLDISYVKKMFLEAKNIGIKEIALSGGESLARSDIFDIFDFAKEIGIKNLGVLTNGLLVEEKLARLIPYLVDNVISLVISFDSLNPETHNYIRNFDLAWQRTKGIIDELALLKRKIPEINFNVITIILNQNLEELLDVANYILSSKANSLQFQAFLPNNLRMAERKKSQFWVPQERLQILDQAIDKLISFKKSNAKFIKNSVSNFSLMKKYYRGTLGNKDVECGSIGKTILISNKGVCTTCFSPYGDIKNKNLIEVIQSKEAMNAKEEVGKCVWPCLLPCFCDYEL